MTESLLLVLFVFLGKLFIARALTAGTEPTEARLLLVVADTSPRCCATMRPWLHCLIIFLLFSFAELLKPADIQANRPRLGMLNVAHSKPYEQSICLPSNVGSSLLTQVIDDEGRAAGTGACWESGKD